MGHSLDPLATGVLPIALGRATRLLQFLPQGKSYQATIRLGVTTTTDDLAGEIIRTHPASELSLETVEAALQGFLGPVQQVPLPTAPCKFKASGFIILLALASRLPLPPARLRFSSWKSSTGDPEISPELDVAIACGAGTYIRAIARDLGAVLQTGGT